MIGCFWGSHLNGETSSKRQALEVKNCYAWGSITIDDVSKISYSGGFFGIIDATTLKPLTLTNCYAAQTDTAAGSNYSDQVPDNDDNGGLACLYENQSGQVLETALFWDTETSGLDVSQYGTGHITSWLQTQASYEAAGWDFDTIWVLTETDTTTGTAGGPVRLIDYEYSTEIVYVVELGDGYMRFYKEAD